MVVIVKRRAKPPAVSNDTNPFVIPYGRFSSDRQKKGGSQLRQEDERAKLYADKIGLPLNESLRMFDEAHSAFHGHHIAKGALGKFLAAIEAGLIPTGSILWVESIDRLTRQNPMAAIKMILFDIIAKGVGIYVDDLHTLYDSKNADDQIPELYGEIKRAYRESKRKSDLANASWDQRRERVRKNGGQLDAKIPHWIKVEGPNKRVLRAGAKKSFTMMFRLKEKLKGSRIIARRLNDKAPWSPPLGWTDKYVERCLENRALLGEKHPAKQDGGKRKVVGEPIADYYPAAVDEPLFLNVQRIIRERSKGRQNGGRNDKCHNVLQSLTKCGYCGGKVYYRSQDIGRLYCINSVRDKSVCECPGIPYHECEDAVLDQCRRLRPDQILPKKDQQAKLCRALRLSMQRISATLEERQERIANLSQLLETTTNSKRQARHENRIIELETEQSAGEKELAEAHRELKKAEREERSFADWQANIESLKKAIVGQPEKRQQLNTHLHEFIDRIEVFSRGLPPEYDGDDFGDYFYAGLDEAEHQQGRPIKLSKPQRDENEKFVQWAMAQQRTKAGRFLRVHLKVSDAWREQMQKDCDGRWNGYIDVVPDGSIGGMPDMDSVWQLFKSKRKSPRKTS